MSGTVGSPGRMKYACSECTGRSSGTVRPAATSACPATCPPYTRCTRLVGRPAAEDVDLDLLQVEQVEELVQRVAHAPAAAAGTDGNSAARKRDRCRDASAPGVLAGAQESTRRTRALVTAT